MRYTLGPCSMFPTKNPSKSARASSECRGVGPCRMHGMEGGKVSLCAGVRRSWRAYMKKRARRRASSRAYHDILSSSVCSPCIRKRELERGCRAHGGQRGCVDHKRVDRYVLCCGGIAQLRARVGFEAWPSSSDVGTSLLEQADMLVSEGVGERVHACTRGDFDRACGWAGVASSWCCREEAHR